MEDAPDELVVEFEEVNGWRRMKRLADGSHPLDMFAKMITDENREWRKTHNGHEGYDVVIEPVRGSDGGSDHKAIVIYHTPYQKQREIISKTIIVDATTGEPAGKINRTCMKVEKHDQPEHVLRVFTAEIAREEAAKRALHLRAGDMRAIKALKDDLEGPI